MKALALDLRRGLAGPEVPRFLPFAAFIALMALQPWLSGIVAPAVDPRWLYALRAGAAGGLLIWLWPRLGELAAVRLPNGRQLALAGAVGGAVLAVWLLLDSGLFLIGEAGAGFDPRHADGSLDWALVAVRLAGAALVVPVMEELFWRSWLMRRLQESDWLILEPRRVALPAVLLSSIVFGFEHQQWAAGIVAGLAYAWLYIVSGNLWVAVFAHAVTNGGLGIVVLLTGAWHFW